MSRLFPEPTLYAVVGPHGELQFENGQALIFETDHRCMECIDGDKTTVPQEMQGVKVVEDEDF